MSPTSRVPGLPGLPSPLLVVDVYPTLLQPEGDRGNAVALAYRARRYGHDVGLLTLQPGDDFPSRRAVFLVGGSEDDDIGELSRLLRDAGDLQRAVEAGSAVLGVGAGFAVLTRQFVDATGRSHRGVGLLDAEVVAGSRAVGPVVTRPNPAMGLPELSGYEDHRGRVTLGAEVAPLAELEVGVGNGRARRGASATDGAVSGAVVGSWLHGPLLPRNPALSDWLLRRVLGDDLVVRGGSAPDDALATQARAARIAEARAAR